MLSFPSIFCRLAEVEARGTRSDRRSDRIRLCSELVIRPGGNVK